MNSPKVRPTAKALSAEVAELRAQLAEARETLDAIRSGAVDAIVVSGGDGDRVFSLESAETPYRRLVEEINEGALLLRPDGTVLYANARFAQMADAPLEEVVGSAWHRFFPAADRGRLNRLLQSSRRGGCREEFCLSGSAPAALPVELSVACLNGTQAEIFSAIVTDLTQRKLAENELRQANEDLEARVRQRTTDLTRANDSLRQSDERLAWVLGTTGVGLWLNTLPFGKLNWDHQTRALFFVPDGLEPAIDLFWSRLHPDDREPTRLAVEKAIRDRALYAIDHRVINPDTGEVRWLRSAGRATYAPDGTPVRFDGINFDITERKQFQMELERLVAERTAKLEELVGEMEHFSYTITHDMRAPLRAMKGFGELVSEMCAACPHPEPRRFLGRMMTAADRMDALIRDALSYSRAVRQELPLDLVDTGALLRGMLDSYPEFQKSKARIEVEGELPVVVGNEAGLTQCFSNLLGNSVKFVAPGVKPDVRIRAEPRGQCTRIWVEDKGIGISPAMLPRVFDMFSRGQNTYEGTGIGLALVRKVMSRMGGKVGVESEEGKGSRFWIELKAG